MGLLQAAIAEEGRPRVLLLVAAAAVTAFGLSLGESEHERVRTEAKRGFLAWALESTKGDPVMLLLPAAAAMFSYRAKLPLATV